MTRAALVIAACLMVSTGAARADACAQFEKGTLALLKTFDAAGQAAAAIGNRCMFRGTDAKAVKQLEASTRRALGRLDTLADPPPACLRSGDFAEAMHAHGQAFGLRVGLAWTLCSPTMPAVIADLRAQHVPDDEIKARVSELSQAWIQSLTK